MEKKAGIKILGKLVLTENS